MCSDHFRVKCILVLYISILIRSTKCVNKFIKEDISFLNVNAVFVSFLHDLVAGTKYSKITQLRGKGADLLGLTIQAPLKIADKLVEFYKNKGRI